MPFLYKLEDHTEYALARRLGEDLPLPVNETLIRVFSDRIQALESVLWDLVEKRDLDTAEGAQLDELGAIVGEPRNGRTDAVYRLWVRARYRANRSSGTPEDSLAIARLVIEPTAIVRYPEMAIRDAQYQIYLEDTAVDAVELKGILNLARPAGVQLDVIVTSGADAFAFDGGPDGLGFNAGKLAGIV